MSLSGGGGDLKLKDSHIFGNGTQNGASVQSRAPTMVDSWGSPVQRLLFRRKIRGPAKYENVINIWYFPDLFLGFAACCSE